MATANGFIVYDDASTINGMIAPARVVPGLTATINSVRGLWLDEASDRLFAADLAAHAILVFDNAGTLDGDVAPARVLSGTATTLISPYDLWLDSASDRLYVATISTASILVFDNASSISGDTAPTRTISGASTALTFGMGLWLDSASDRLYASSGNIESILAFDGASVIDGNVAPARIISGGATSLSRPTGLWLDSGGW